MALVGLFQTFEGKELCPTKEEKGAMMDYSLISNPAFLDGNKRTALYLAKAFIKLNYPKLVRDDFYERLEDVVVAVASDER